MGMLLGYLNYYRKHSLYGIASLAGEGVLNLGKKLFFFFFLLALQQSYTAEEKDLLPSF